MGNRIRFYCSTSTLIITSLVALSTVVSLDIHSCRQPMGMQLGALPGNAGIPDSALSSSSAFDGPSVGPQHARLNIDRSGGAWCPKQQIAENVKEYLQINFVNVSVISGIATQGRYGNGRGQEYAEQFRLEYWRPELALWRSYRRWNGNDILEGNWDTKTVVHHDLSPPIMAKRLRVIPYGIYPRTVCMRVELYGCEWNENIASYSIPVGSSSWSGSVTVEDLSYDGFKDGSAWTGGLGMLTDGEYGSSNFKVDASTLKGQGWVGWKNSSLKQRPIELAFNFESIRNFSALHIHASNQFTKGIQVFSKASLRFSVDGQRFNQKFVNYFYMEDLVLENSRNVTIRIPHICAAHVKIQLWFAAQWIMISEVTFDSEIPEEQHTIDELLPDQEAPENNEDMLNGSDPLPESKVLNTESTHIHGYFEAIVGALSAVMLLLITAIVIIILMSHRKKSIRENIVTFSAPTFDVNLATLNSKEGSVSRYNSEKSYSVQSIQYAQPSTIIDKSSNSSDYSDNGATQPINPISVQFSSLRLNHMSGARQTVVSLNNHFPRISTDPISRRSSGKPARAKIEICDPGVTWNVRPIADRLPVDSVSNSPHAVPEIPRQCLRLVEWLGSSTYGEAYICHVVGASEYENLSMQEPVLVRGGPVKETKHFLAEIKLLSAIDHQNICSLLAYSCSAGMGWMIFECPVYGDLNSYLKQLPVLISNKSVFKFASQVARAMAYLEKKGMVHKDLATRNCLLGPELHVKVSDLAVISAAFKEDYGEVRGRKPLPLRWLPWETLVLDKFTESSGVWMLAVTVWEMTTGARERPYSTMNDTQVILNADHYFYADSKQIILPQPKERPCQLYKWMVSCWSRDEAERPSFNESASFLETMSKDY